MLIVNQQRCIVIKIIIIIYAIILIIVPLSVDEKDLLFMFIIIIEI